MQGVCAVCGYVINCAAKMLDIFRFRICGQLCCKEAGCFSVFGFVVNCVAKMQDVFPFSDMWSIVLQRSRMFFRFRVCGQLCCKNAGCFSVFGYAVNCVAKMQDVFPFSGMRSIVLQKCSPYSRFSDFRMIVMQKHSTFSPSSIFLKNVLQNRSILGPFLSFREIMLYKCITFSPQWDVRAQCTGLIRRGRTPARQKRQTAGGRQPSCPKNPLSLEKVFNRLQAFVLIPDHVTVVHPAEQDAGAEPPAALR